MKKIISYLLIATLFTGSFCFSDITETKALEKKEYVTNEKLSKEEELDLLNKYDTVTVYSSGTHSTMTILDESTSKYGFVGYHPQTPNWKTATGYSVSTSKTVSFKVSLNYNVTNDFSIKIGAAASNTTTHSDVYDLTDAEKNLVRNKGYRTRLGVYAKVKREVVNYKIYDNATGQLLQNFNHATITTWDGAGVKGEVDYRVELKKIE